MKLRVLMVVALLVALFALWRVVGLSTPTPDTASTAVDVPPAPPDAPAVNSPKPSARPPRQPQSPPPPAPPTRQPAESAKRLRDRTSAENCAEGTQLICKQGDVWTVDVCTGAEGLEEECGTQLCRAGACVSPEGPTCDPLLSEYGRCVGDTVETCHAGRKVTVDCTSRGERCVESDHHGAHCRAPGPNDCRGRHSRCDGDVLEQCLDGAWARTDCAEFGATCQGNRCERSAGSPTLWPGAEPEDCGPCGCDGVVRRGPPGDEVCDGLDNDGDGEADEDVDCAPVDILAFRMANGQSTSFSDQDILAEIGRMNEHMLSAGLTLRLADIVTLDAPGWLDVDDTDIQDMYRAPELHPDRGGFFVPVVFTDTITTGGAPKLGIATLPGNQCGSNPTLSAADRASGVIVLAKYRHETTGVHELGHFFGLCHTHGGQTRPVLETATSEGERLECNLCELEGDGICDTPHDPGRELCAATSTCEAMCRHVGVGAELPDVTNVMSYYHQCRSSFSTEQGHLMREVLARRRALHDCVDCACGDNGQCPLGMGCRPYGPEAWRCAPAGTRPIGAACAGHQECVAGGLCASLAGATPQCRVACVPGAAPAGCDCAALAGTGTGVCR